MQRYTPKDIEPKWQRIWDESGTYTADLQSDKPKYIAMSMFNYPSGNLHIGHAMNFTISDVKARFKRQQGFESYHPVGWDSFGLPAENRAIKEGMSPQESMAQLIPDYHRAYKAMGWSNDWEKEIATHLPEYYKWTQWIFWKMHQEGLAYQDTRMQWWCAIDNSVLANEQVIDGKCWRHDGPDDPLVEKREVKQWFFKITDYADELLEAIEPLDWTPSVKLAQKNWIGRSEGAEIAWKVCGKNGEETGLDFKTFTTRKDTLPGVTFIVIAPESELLDNLTSDEQRAEVDAYSQATTRLSELERQEDKEKTGVFTGRYAKNPFNDQIVPIYAASYVLAGYGTGVVMGMGGHDLRDREFALKHDIPMILTTEVPKEYEDLTSLEVWSGEGKQINTGAPYDGMDNKAAGQKIFEAVVAKGAAEPKVNYRMRDWSVSRQRYWGAPIPIVHCPACYKADEFELEVDFQHQAGFEDVAAGKKTVLTRAYGQQYEALAKGSVLKLTSNQTKQALFAKAVAVQKVADVAALFATDIPSRTFMKDFRSVDELKAEYNGNRPGFADELDEYGIAVVEFELLKKPVLLPEDQLPVVLPELDDFQPSGDGRSALARAKDWLKVDCPKCGGPAERETDTLDTYICSSWYMYRYFDPHNQQAIFASNIVKKWEPVDFYNGADHATAHLLYARFIGHFFKKIGLVNEAEPFKQFLFNGKVTASDGTMFSKSKGNGVDPLEIIAQGYGADALRTYLMFAAPLEIWAKWDPQGVPGTHRFLSRIWNLVQEYNESSDIELADAAQADINRATHAMIKKVTEDLESNRYNTAIAAMMACTNDLYKLKERGFGKHEVWHQALANLVACVGPFAPHVSEELWHQLGHSATVNKDTWPQFDEKYLATDTITIAVQVNGKLRGEVEVPAGADEAATVEAAQANDKVSGHLNGQTIRKTIYVPAKLVNFVL